MGDEPMTFDDAYAAHADVLVRLAFLACGDRASAEDVVHDAFVRWHRARPGPAPGSEGAYLRRIVLNLASNHHRHARRRPDSRLPKADTAPGVDDRAVQAAVAGRVVAAVRALPRRQRDCVLLAHYDGLRVDEIADVLGVSTGSVKTHLHRARAHLRTALEDLQ